MMTHESLRKLRAIFHARRGRLSVGMTGWAAAALLAATAPLADCNGATCAGKSMSIGQGRAHTVVRTNASGNVAAISIVLTEGALEGLPEGTPRKGHFSYFLPMPTGGPRTLIDHVSLDWEALGHPPPHVYDVPHFDFHFYMVSRAEQMRVLFGSEADSALPSQQPPASLVRVGYVVPPGTAMSRMGVHGVNTAAPEFHGKPFTSTFNYGYYQRRLTFLEPMVSMAFLKSKPVFSGAVMRPASYSFAGDYPSAYSVKI